MRSEETSREGRLTEGRCWHREAAAKCETAAVNDLNNLRMSTWGGISNVASVARAPKRPNLHLPEGRLCGIA